MNQKPLLTLLAVIFIMACKKSADQPGPPTSEPLTVAAAKPGDTVYIRGENFSKDIAKNTVQINGATATVIVVSTTELKVVIPPNATTGAVTITVNGQTVEAGTLTIVPPTLFVYKRNYADQNNYLRQIFTIDPASGQETLLYTRTDTLGVYFDDPVYLPATNEVIGLTWSGNILLRLNVTTKQATYVVLTNDTEVDYQELVVDKFSNLYAIKRDFSDPSRYMQSLVKIDPKTGIQTAVKTFEYGTYWESLVYVATENKVVGIADEGTQLLGVNLTTKDTTWKALPMHSNEYYFQLAVDNQSNLYGVKAIYDFNSLGQGQFYKLNPATGQGTLLHTFTNYSNLETNMVYLPHRNELVAVWNINKLYTFNVTTKANSTVPLTPGVTSVTYGHLVTN